MIWVKKGKEKKDSDKLPKSSALEGGSSTTEASPAGSSTNVTVKEPSQPPVKETDGVINFRAAPNPPEAISHSPILNEELATKKYGGNIRSVLSEGTVINGRLTFDTPVKIDGKLSGEVFSTKALVVGRTGKINASINVENLIIMGEVEGDVKAKESIEVLPGGRLLANIHTKKLIINDAFFNGNCKMSQ